MVEYSLVRSRRRTISISVGHSGVVVRSPTNAPLNQIERFVNDNVGWIEKQMRRTEKEKALVLMSGAYIDRLPYMGGFLPIAFQTGGKREKVEMMDRKFVVKVSDASRENVSRVYSRWLRRAAAAVFSDSISKYKRLVGVEPSSVSIRDQKTRWGSASPSGRVSLNFNLLKAPKEILDYVVLHELCHLKVHNHSKKFWKLVESVMPEYRFRKKWLSQNGTILRS